RACAAGKFAVGGAGLIQDLERVERWRRLTSRATQVGLEPVAKTTVRVAIAAECLNDRLGRPAGEQQGVSVAVHQPGGRPDKPLGSRAINRHAPDATRPSACGL